jgi:hypothetical protein
MDKMATTKSGKSKSGKADFDSTRGRFKKQSCSAKQYHGARAKIAHERDDERFRHGPARGLWPNATKEPVAKIEHRFS